MLPPTQNEITTLNNIIGLIPLDEDFEIEELHAKILPHTLGINSHFKGGDRILANARLARRGLYKNIEKYLVDRHFAKAVNVNSERRVLKLTPRGRVLCAFGSTHKFFVAEAKRLTDDELMRGVERIISQAFDYGEFTVETVYQSPQFIHANPVTEEGRKEIEQWLNKITDYKSQLVDEYNSSKIDEEILQYLVANGFAINRHDIKQEGVIYRQLTEKGRMLKELGSIAAFNAYSEQTNHRIKLQDRRTSYLYWINFWIAVGTIAAALYASVQLVDYFSNLIAKRQPLYYGTAVTVYIWLLGCLCGISSILIIQRLRKQSRERKTRS